ncbi:Hypothetical predicted protein [Cloeon dipterum]|nr:Hypothetical predicted protein [Cloeon dipterum]
MELKEEGEARHAVQGHFPSSSDAPGRFQSSGPIEIPKPVASQEAIPSASKIESKSGFCVMCEKLYPCIETHSETELHKNKTKIIASDNKKTLVPANSIECEFTKCLKCKFLIYTKRLNSHNSCYSELACKQFGRGNFYCLMCQDRFETFERLAVHWKRDHFHNNSYIIVLIRGLYTLLPENIDLTQALQFCCKFCQLFTFRNRLECLCASRGHLDSNFIA